MSILNNKVTFSCHEYSGFSFQFKQGGGALVSVYQTNDNPDTNPNPSWFQVPGYDPILGSSFTSITSPSLVDYPAVGAWAKIEVVSTGTGTGIFRVYLKATRAISSVNLIEPISPIPVTSSQEYLAPIVDEGATYTYIGLAQPGTLTSTASWQIRRMTNSNPTTITYADGNSSFDNIWDNRLTLSYA